MLGLKNKIENLKVKKWGDVLSFYAFPFTYICVISEKAMAHHSSPIAWKIPWTEEPGRLQSMGLLRVRHD